MKSLVIIPAYNEEKSIDRTVEDIRRNAPDFDFVVVNDCSSDQTLGICLEKGYPVLNLPVNLGIGGAVQTGYRYARQNGYEVAVQFDGDGQHDAAYLDAMRDKLLTQKLDMVIGSRFLEKEGFQSSGIRRLGIRYFTRLIRILTGTVITDPTSGMRMAGKTVIAEFADNYPKDYPEPESVVRILRQGCKVQEYPVKMRRRTEGTSSISPGRSIYYMVKVTLAIFMEMLRRQ
ncbi:MAG: glycosyltransferase family 2 protein [Lachnospiraceae bacterium]|nr:glycosyltransferase family 2 protein [Lachnospiraceae bacterium]